MWDALAAARRTLEIEANAVTDNPLVFPDGDVVSQGNFHGEPVAMALDAMAVALAELGSIAERRIDKLMNPVFSGLLLFDGSLLSSRAELRHDDRPLRRCFAGVRK